MADLDLEAIEARINTAYREVAEIAKQGRSRWRTSIPARLDRDSDLLLAAGLTDARTLLAEVRELRGRLRAAEAVCVMYGISPARFDTAHEKAAYEVWLTWAELVGPGATTSHPDLTDERIAELAGQRDAKRADALARLAEREATSPPAETRGGSS